MVLKTFNVQEDTYGKFSQFCKEMGLSMSKQVQRFMERFVEEEPVARKDYLKKLEKLRKGKFIKVSNFEERY